MSMINKQCVSESCDEIVNVQVLPEGPTGCIAPCPDDADGLDPEILEKLCDILEAIQMPVGIELGSIEVGCITDAEGTVTGKVYMCIVKDELNTTTTTELKAISYADGSITAPYTGPISPCDGTCPVEEPCLTKDIQSISCVAVDQSLPEGTKVLTIQTLDCNNVIISSNIYELPSVTLYTGEPLLTEDCDPAPDIETLNECFVDTDGNQWTRVLIFDPLGVDPDIEIFYDSTLTPGTPAGDPKEWTPCPNVSGLVDIEKTCFEYFGEAVKGYAFAYSDGEVQLGTGISPDSAVVVNNAAVFCCDDCIQVFGCRDGRLAWPAGSEVVMANGDVIDITGLRYSQVGNLIVDTYGGTFSGPSLGGPGGPNFSQCQGSSQHELQFINLPVQITSITDLTSYGTFGNCMPQSQLDKLCEIAKLLTCEDAFTACTRVDAFHSADMLDIGDTTTYEIKLDGVVQSTIVHDHTTTYTAPNRSTMYTPIIAAINALPNWTWALISETGWNVTQKQEWQVDYSGPGDEELTVCMNSGGQLNNLRLYVDASGVLHTQAYSTPPASNTDTGIDFNTAAFRDCP